MSNTIIALWLFTSLFTVIMSCTVCSETNVWGFQTATEECRCDRIECNCGPCWASPDHFGRVRTYARKENGRCAFGTDCGKEWR